MRGEEVTAATTVERYYLYQGAGRPRLTDWLDVQYSIVGWQIWPIRSGRAYWKNRRHGGPACRFMGMPGRDVDGAV